MPDKIDRSLKNSFRDGTYCAVMQGCTEQYLTPCALALGAGTGAIGLLSACSNLFASWSQLFSTFWVHHFKSRRQFIVAGVLLQAYCLLPLAILPYLPLANPVVVFIPLAVLFVSAGAIIVPAWGSLMSDHVPAPSRGRYFGWRNSRLGLMVVASCLAAGLILYATHHISALIGFTTLFCLAMCARLVSAYYVSRMEDLPFHESHEDHFTLWMFIKRIRESNFVHFVLFIASITFATNLAGPFFSVYMLRDLNFNYAVYMMVVLASTVTSFAGMRLWGKQADHVGNARVLRLTACFLPLVPLLWTLSASPPYLVCVEMFSGFIWGGFNLAASNFIYDAVTPAKRIRCIAYFNIINGTALALGALLGGFLAPHMPSLLGHRLLTLFLLSCSVRILVVIILGPTFKEVRLTPKVSSLNLFFSVIGIRPLTGTFQKEETS